MVAWSSIRLGAEKTGRSGLAEGAPAPKHQVLRDGPGDVAGHRQMRPRFEQAEHRDITVAAMMDFYRDVAQ